MATTIQAAQISTNTSSWYQKIRKIQAKTNQYFGTTTKITQSSDPAISAGSKATAAQMNAFLSVLNGLQSNTFLGKADWSQKVSSVSSGSKITYKSNIDTIITSLQAVCSQYGTQSTYTNETLSYYNCSDYQTEANHSDDAVDTQTNYTVDDSVTTYNTDSYNNSNGNYSNDTTWSEEVGDMTYDYGNSGDSTCNDETSYDTYTDVTSYGTEGVAGGNSTWSESPYSTEGPGCQNYGYHEDYGVNGTSHSNGADSLCSTDSVTNECLTCNYCSECETYGYNPSDGTCVYEWFYATADYSRSADTCSTCTYWDNGNSTYGEDDGGNTTYDEVFYTCAKHGHTGDATNNVSISYSTYNYTTNYGTYTVTGNSVYSN